VINVFEPDILHVYRSGYPEFPVGQVEVPHVVETNVFGFLDRNPKIKRTLFMSKWLMDCSLGLTSFMFPDYSRFDFVNNPVESPYTDDKLKIFSWPQCDSPGDGVILLGRCGRPDNGIYNSVNVDAVRLLRLQGYDIRFVVVAPPSNMIKDMENYNIPYYNIDPTTNPLVLSMFYNTIDIYAHARADGETFGVNIAEAMMHGKPVVTHQATPSFPGMGVFQSQTELVDDGETGYIVDNDPSSYAEALKQMIDDEEMRLDMGIHGQQKAEREYHVDACMDKLENIYRDVVAGDKND
jgi:hypothetical protein